MKKIEVGTEKKINEGRSLTPLERERKKAASNGGRRGCAAIKTAKVINTPVVLAWTRKF